MDKKNQMNFNTNNFLLASTNILDAREIEEKKLDENHSLRIAYICLKIANKLQYKAKMMFDLCAFSLFHEYINEERMELLNIDNSQNKLSDIVNIVHILDVKFSFYSASFSKKEEILHEISFMQMDDHTREIIVSILQPLDFWLDCNNTNIMIQYIYENLENFTLVLSFEKVLDITMMFGTLYENVEEFIEKCKCACEYFQFDHKDTMTFLIAGSMLNFGKLAIRAELLQKKDKLTSSDYEIIKSNVYHNKNALKLIYGFDDISKWASRHHEQLNAQGYPSLLSANELSLKDRIMAILYKLHALLQDKSYRRAFSLKESMAILDKKAENKEIDKVLLNEIKLFLKD